MAPLSKFRRLPPEIRDKALDWFAQGKSVDEVTQALRGLGADISRGGVGRARRQWEISAAKLREKRDLVDSVVRDLASQPESKLPRLNAELIQSALLDNLAAMEARKLPPEQAIPLLLKSSMTLQNTARATRDDVDATIKVSGFAEAQEGDLLVKQGDRLMRVEIVDAPPPAALPDAPAGPVAPVPASEDA